MKILELTNFSAGGCGVFARVKQEALLLSKKGHEVRIFSSWFEKGTDKIMPENDAIGNVKMKRFPAKNLGGESFMSWHFEKDAEEYKPDLIIAHSYRHPHTTRALCVAEKIGCKTILVTHAPFGREANRGLINNIAVKLYDLFIGKKMIKKFDKVFAITKWEIPYLEKLGVNKDKIEYVPNGVSEEYFSHIKSKKKKKILYAGRIAPIKNLEVVVKALKDIKEINLEIFGPAEKSYLEKLKKLIRELNLEDRIKMTLKTYNRKEHVKELDKAEFFILPSKSEGMPQSLIESMAAGKVVIASDIPAHQDLMENGKNGFLFKNNDEKDLAETIKKIMKMNDLELKNIGDNARKSVEQFKWSKIIDKIDKLIRSI